MLFNPLFNFQYQEPCGVRHGIRILKHWGTSMNIYQEHDVCQ